MAACVNSGLAHAPDYTPHRVRVTAPDSGVITSKPSGMVSEPYEDVFADIKIAGGPPTLTIEVMLWSEQSGAFLSQTPAVQFTALAASKMLKFNAGGNRFLLYVTGTFSGAQVDIACAGANPVFSQAV